MKKLKEFKSRTNYQNLGSLVFKLNLSKALFLVFCFSMSFLQGATAKSISSSDFENLEPMVLNQQTQISGTISDKDGPIPGASILIKDTTIGVQSDFDGNFSISVDDTSAILVISSVGYKTQEIVVGDRTNIDVLLEIDVAALDEVVVLGYTTRKKGDVTGSVSTVKSKVIAQAATLDLEKSLAGKVSGLIVSDRGGLPGDSDTAILIRGRSTLGNNSPLILIDGISSGTFSHLAPTDIESLTVLKDGAAAIYGARAANGVILITTKRGKLGAPKISITSSYINSSFASRPELMSSEQFAIYNNEIAERGGSTLPYSPEQINDFANGNAPNTNWLDETLAQSSPESRVAISISGGADKVNYFVSGDLLRQEGLYKSGDTKFKQNQVRSNIDVEIFEDFKVGVDLSGRFGDSNQPGVDDGYIYKHIYTNDPTQVAFHPNGLPAWGGENGANPAVMSSNESGFINEIRNDLRGKFSVNYDLNKLAEGLKFIGFAGIRKMNNDEKSWYTPWTTYNYQSSTDEYIGEPGFSQRGNERILRETFWKYDELMINATLHYKATIEDNHNLSGFIGYEQMESEQRNFWVEKRGFPTSDHSDLFAGDVDGQQSNGTSQEWGRVNYFASLSYDFNKKYYVDFTIRHDGSSNFGDGNRFGTFPGVGASWAIDKEGFMENAKWLDALKLRASWAIMGNDRVAGFQYLTRYNYAGNLGAQPNYYVLDGTPQNGFSSLGVPAANPNITWETADMKNIGINFLMFDGRLSGDINYFYQKREDILIPRNASVPDFTGLTLPEENLGKVDNFGYEMEFGWNDKIGEVDYNLGFNFTQAKNEVVFLDEAEDVADAMKREGHPMDSYIIYPTNGLFQNQEQIDNAPATLAGTVPGEPYYIDTDGNGSIGAEDRVRTYSSNVPEIQYGFYGGLNYKHWNMNFLFQGQAEAEILVFFEGNGSLPDFMYNDRWTPDNTTASIPRAFSVGDSYSASLNGPDNFQGADLWLKDASYLRLKELEVGYTFTKEQIKFGDMKVYFRAYNLLTMFSDIQDMGLDPEAAGYNGFRNSTYGSLKTITFGLNINL